MPTATLSELREGVYTALENNTRFYSAAEVTDAINDAVKTLNLFTGFLTASANITAVANRLIYDTPAAVLIPTGVKFEGKALEKTSLSDIGQDRPRWMKETTATTGEPVAIWVPIGFKKFAIHPGDSIGGGTITVTGVAEPVALVNDSDVITFPDEYADALEDYAAHLVQFKAGGQVAAAAMTFYQGFLGLMKELKRYKGKINPAFFFEVEQPSK